MPKRQLSLNTCSCSAAAAKRPAQRKQHLYLVLDDWRRGYSIHKVDVDTFDSDSDDEPKPFSEPPLARFEVFRGYSYSIAAHGTTIVAMRPSESNTTAQAYDTATLAVSVFPLLEYRFDYNFPLMVSVEGKLFLFIFIGSYYLTDPPRAEAMPWAWIAIDSKAPFYSACIHCYAVHPDGRTIFFSAVADPTAGTEGTFFFDTERLELTRVGGWRLPFYGQAHYDAKMDAWVGLCRHEGGRGRLCSSDVVPVATASGPTTLPRWKFLDDRLVHVESPSHIGATLVYMGNNKFCVVESMWHKDDESKMVEAKKRYISPDRVVLSMTMVVLRYDDDGELRLSERRRHCRVFNKARLLEADIQDEPVAFWI